MDFSLEGLEGAMMASGAKFLASAERHLVGHLSSHKPDHAISELIEFGREQFRGVTHIPSFLQEKAQNISGGQYAENVQVAHHGGRAHQEVALG